MTFLLQFSTGESALVTGTGLIGRSPVAQPGEFFDQLVPVHDPGRAMSKTHLEFGISDEQFWIVDRFSGNGTTITVPDTAAARRCDPGKRYFLPRGSRVDIGDQFFIVG